MKHPTRLLIAAATLVAASSAHAATITKGATGTDLTLGTDWNGGVAPTAADIATWDSTSLGAGLTIGSDVSWGTINITGALSNIDISGAGQITTGNITLTGAQTLVIANAIALSGNAVYDIADVTGNANADATLSGVISGAFGITKNGAGTLVLGNTGNNYSGGVTINAGTLEYANSTVYGFGLSNALINAGGTLNLRSTTNSVDGPAANSGTITGTGTLNKVGSGYLDTTTNFNPTGFTGQVNVVEGVLASNGDANWAASTNTMKLNVASGAAFDVRTGTVTVGELSGAGRVGTTFNQGVSLVVGGRNTDTTFSGVLENTLTYAGLGNITGGGNLSLTKTGTGKLTLTGANTYTGATTISGGTLQIGAGGTTGSLGAGAVTDNAALIFNRSDSVTVANAISGSGSFTQAGTGTLTLTGANTYTGATTIAAGTLLVSGSLASGSAVALNAGTLTGAGTIAGTVTVATGGAAITAGNGVSGTLTLGNLTFAGTGTVNIGTLSNYTSAAAVNVTGALALNGGAGAVTLNLGAAPVVSGTYALLGFGSGTVSTSAFTLGNMPTLSSRQSGTLTVNGNTLDYVVAGDSPKWTGAQSNAWTTGIVGGASNWKLITAGTATDYIEGDAVLFDDSATGTTSVNISTANVSPGVVTFNNATQNYTIGSTGGFGIAGTGSLSVTGTGTVTINTANTYSGGTTITAGTLVTGTGTALGTGAVALTGGTVNLDGQTLANAFTLGGGAIAGTGTLTGVLSGGALNYNGAGGTLTLTGANTYTGATTVTAGTLQVGGAGTLGSGAYAGALALSSGTTFNYASSANQTLSGVISGAGSLTQSGSGTLTLTAANTYAGATTINSGTVTLGHLGSLRNTSGITIAAGATLNLAGTDVNADRDMLMAGTPGGSLVINGTLANIGNSETRLYPGTITMNNGTIACAGGESAYGSFAVSGTGNRTITANGLLNTITGGGSGGIGLDSGLILTFNTTTTNDALAVSAVLGATVFNSGGIAKTGAGAVTLTAANTYTGGTTVSAGTLLVNNTTGSGTGSGAVSVNGGMLGGTGFISGGTVTVASGAILQGGAGAASGALTLGGGVTLQSGSIIQLALGAPGTSSTLARTGGGTWTFFGTQQFTFLNIGGAAAPGTYTLITGLAADPGSEANWTITNAGWTGTFSYAANAISLSLTAVPEPSTYGLIGAGALAAVAVVRRRRRTNIGV